MPLPKKEKSAKNPARKTRLKYEMTLDRGDFFPFASSAVKGHFFEFLVSNIMVTSLSRISGAALANGTHFSSSNRIFCPLGTNPNVGPSQGWLLSSCIFWAYSAPPVFDHADS
ncbi:MAG: hypothetical protein K6F56_09250 [Oscillospiraceae bacterium]|nr:hypothetical protein [Oscillospiraceae bacterium]